MDSSLNTQLEHAQGAKARIAASELVNLRDLGGIRVRAGLIRRSMLLRSDDVSTIPATQAAELVQSGLRTVIDLRSLEETAHTGRGPLWSHAVNHHHLPLTAQMATPTALLARLAENGGTPQTVGSWYASLVRDRAESIVRGLRVVAESEGAVLFHCAAGKDRTGVFAASILTVLGADPEEIVADYARTDAVMPAILARLRPVMAALAGGTPGAVPGSPRGALLSAPADTMREMIVELEREPGGFQGVLRSAGLEDELVDRLRGRLVAP